jgi:hypothetical protein
MNLRPTMILAVILPALAAPVFAAGIDSAAHSSEAASGETADGISVENTAEEPDRGETAGEDSEPIEFPPEIQKLLTEPSEGETYTAPERCISTRSIRQTHILDDRHIVFESAGSNYHLVQFQRRCPRLQKHSTLIYETTDSRLCRLDMIRPSNGMHDISPPCSIPGFIPITREQMVLLRETIEARKAAARG